MTYSISAVMIMIFDVLCLTYSLVLLQESLLTMSTGKVQKHHTMLTMKMEQTKSTHGGVSYMSDPFI